MKVIAVIPARYESTRLPGKPLLKIRDKTIVQMVYERTSESTMLDEVLVATDDERICDHVMSFGGQAVMTSREHATGTDRIAEAVSGIDADVVVNVQGDEPLITHRVIESILPPFQQDPDVQMTTIRTEITDRRDLFNPNVVKVVTDRNGNAIYFSRSPIPFRKTPQMALFFDVSYEEVTQWYRHVGLYAYRKRFLTAFSQMEAGVLEKLEGLEQLRALEHGARIHVVDSQYTGVGIDTHEDYIRLKDFLGDDS